MATEANTKKAEELVVNMLGYVHESDVRGLAEVLDAAEQRGREEERKRWKRLVAEAVKLYERTEGCEDATAILRNVLEEG